MSQVWVECTCTLPAPCDFPSGISVFAVSLSFFPSHYLSIFVFGCTGSHGLRPLTAVHGLLVSMHGLFLVVGSGGYSPVAVHGLLIAVASLVVEYRL